MLKIISRHLSAGSMLVYKKMIKFATKDSLHYEIF